MTALQIAQDECANYSGGKCLGFQINDALQTVAGRPMDRCVLGTLGIRCQYFEQCVAPMVRNMDSLGPDMDRRRKRKSEFETAIHRYARSANVPFREIVGV